MTGLLDGLQSAWAYVGLAVTAFWGSELVALLAGFASEQGHLLFLPVVLALGIGAWVVAVTLYFLGRWRAPWVRLKARSAPPAVRAILRILRTNPWRSTLLARFVFGGHILLPLACGAARVPAWIFLSGTAFAAAAWSVSYAGLGWFFGESAVALLGQVRAVEEVVAGVVVTVAVIAVVRGARRRRKRAAESAPADL